VTARLFPDRDDDALADHPALTPRRFTNCRTCGTPLTAIPEARAAGFCSRNCGEDFYGECFAFDPRD
jgi:hypothetical protein